MLSAATDEVRIFEAADVRLPKVSARLDLPYPSPSPSGRVQPGVFGDFNGDGRVDALFNLGDTLTIAWGDDGRFRERVSIPWPRGAAPSGPALAAADLDGDGRDEALLSNATPDRRPPLGRRRPRQDRPAWRVGARGHVGAAGRRRPRRRRDRRAARGPPPGLQRADLLARPPPPRGRDRGDLHGPLRGSRRVRGAAAPGGRRPRR
ncbi:MAG: VCBS repeat-containing protein [Myxococcales bacterium]|nr:VCBS repeat-containing protein [Myxococcales bacterium]